MPAERTLLAEILLRCARGGVRLFRINAGKAWQGKVIEHTRDRITLQHPRVFHGAPEGFPDLIGMRSIVITQDMVGQRVAIFVAIEAKTKNTRTTKQQSRFHSIARKLGAIVSVARSHDDAARALDDVHDLACERDEASA